MSNSDSMGAYYDKDIEGLMKKIEKLTAENDRLTLFNKRLLNQLDQVDLAGKHRTEAGLTLMTGVILKKVKRRKVTVSNDEFLAFMETNTVNMKTDGEDAITYTLKGDF